MTAKERLVDKLGQFMAEWEAQRITNAIDAYIREIVDEAIKSADTITQGRIKEAVAQHRDEEHLPGDNIRRNTAPVAPEPENGRRCDNCFDRDTSREDDPCAPCFDHDRWTPATPEPPRWTPKVREWVVDVLMKHPRPFQWRYDDAPDLPDTTEVLRPATPEDFWCDIPGVGKVRAEEMLGGAGVRLMYSDGDGNTFLRGNLTQWALWEKIQRENNIIPMPEGLEES